MVTDPIADMLTRIRNANLALHERVAMPSSGMRREIARILNEEGYIDGFAVERGQTFDTLELALSAATRGQGIALGDLNLIRENLSDGVLVAPFDLVLDQGVSYYLLYPPHRRQLPKIQVLRDWLVAAAGGAGASG